MKNFKKLLCVVLTIAMLFSISACSKNNESVNIGDIAQDITKQDPEKEATKVAEDFLDAFIEFDADEMAQYLDDPSVLDEFTEITQQLNVDTIMNSVVGEMPEELAGYEYKFEPLIEDIIDKMMESLEYEISDVKEDNGSYIFTAELTVPTGTSDFENLANSLDSDAFEDALLELVESGKISENSSDEEIINAVFDIVIPMLEDAIDDVEFDKETETIELVVVENGGNWVIDTKASDME